ncbi:hypothetical protein F3681_01790 [Escherichia coli]|nr:hypothetical protein [Escherichia coli]
MSNKYEDLIKSARMNADCGEHMSPAEVTTLLNVVEAKCAALAAENAGLKSAFDKPQAYLSWHAIPPTWEDPLPCGEYLDVHDDAGHKNSDGTDCWPVYAKPEIETPATDAFLAEVRAQGVEMLVKHCEQKALEKSYDFFMDAGAVAAQFAAQLRQEAVQ